MLSSSTRHKSRRRPKLGHDAMPTNLPTGDPMVNYPIQQILDYAAAIANPTEGGGFLTIGSDVVARRR
jgi:hypothetical protein